VLESLVDQQVRVAAQSFCPLRLNGDPLPHLIPTADLLLPDNSRPGVLPVYFEGRLDSFVRRIGVVEVTLASPPEGGESAEGIVPFRGAAAVIVRGPATVRLSFPFKVERLPSDLGNYWRDLQLPSAQFELPL